MMTAKSPKNRWVVCYDYASGPFTQEKAERQLANQKHLDYCPWDHDIVTSETKPLASWEQDLESQSDLADETEAYGSI